MKFLLCLFVASVEAVRVSTQGSQVNSINAVNASDLEVAPGVSAIEVGTGEVDVAASDVVQSDVAQSDEFQSEEVQSDMVEGNHPREVNVLHHNPHWECFDRDASGQCKREAWAQYTRLMTQYSCDFAGLLMGGAYVPPSNYGKLEHLSGRDKAVLMWRKSRWELEDHRGHHLMPERAFIAARFRSKQHADFSVVVVAAHYDHAQHHGVSAGVQHVRHAVQVLSQGKTKNIVILADTNQLHSHKDARKLLAEVGASTHVVWGDDVVGSCCLDGHFAGGGMTYDRTIANFGKHGTRIDDPQYVQLTNRYKKGPHWAYHAKKLGGHHTAAYHHPVLLKITV